MNELILKDSDILNPEVEFATKLELASKVATELKKVIQTQGLSVKINGNDYVTAEGWEVLGIMLGCTPYVENVQPLNEQKTIFEATVSIRQGSTILSRASAIAEKNNRQRDRFTVYSMAQTRALGKAYRMALSWIVKMAGYMPTPAEEMPKHTSNYETPKYNLNEVEVDDPEPVKTIWIKLINHCKNNDVELNNLNLKKEAQSYKKESNMSPSQFRELIDFINNNCPEDYEGD